MNSIRFLFPIDGDVLTPADGEVRDGVLHIRARLEAPKGSTVTVNDEPCEYAGDSEQGALYEITLTPEAYRNALTAKATKGGETVENVIYVYRFKKAYKKYRLAIDDIIWSMRDLAVNKDVYASLFDCPFFALFKRLHDDFGTCVHMNIYYTDIYNTFGDCFDLTMVPDKYRDEFIANSGWLKLTFHAHNDTAHIYREAPYSTVYRDFCLTTKELVRICGAETVRTSANGLHYGETNVEGARALRACGVNCLVGYFKLDKQGVPIVSYYLNPEQTTHCFDRDFWVDNKEGIIFSKDKMVIDQQKQECIDERLDYMLAERATEMGTLNFVTHEQYFYPHYSHYQPEYEQKIRTAVKWAADHGYEPCFIDTVITEDYRD